MTATPQGRALRLAADVLDDNGWCQHESQNAAGQMCLLRSIHMGAAIVEPLGANDLWCEAADVVEDVLAQAGWFASPINWNDAPGRTPIEVAALLRMAADYADGIDSPVESVPGLMLAGAR